MRHFLFFVAMLCMVMVGALSAQHPAASYWMASGNLYGYRPADQQTRLISTGGWHGDLEVFGNTVYLMKDGNLYAATLSGFEVAPLQEISKGGWTGDVEFANHSYRTGDKRTPEGDYIPCHYVYLARGGDLYRAPIAGRRIQTALEKVSSGGWEGDLEVARNAIFLMKGGNLYGAIVTPDHTIEPLREITTGGWSGDLEVRREHVVLYTHNGTQCQWAKREGLQVAPLTKAVTIAQRELNDIELVE